MLRISVCAVCGKSFVWRDNGIRQTRCSTHRKIRNIPSRGYYVVVTFCDGLSSDQEDFLARMIDRKLTRRMLCDFVLARNLDGAVVQHIQSGTFYKVMDGELIKINCNGRKKP